VAAWLSLESRGRDDKRIPTVMAEAGDRPRLPSPLDAALPGRQCGPDSLAPP